MDRSLKFQHLLVIGFISLLILSSSSPHGSANASILKRSSSNVCNRSTPCGWMVYRPYSHEPDYIVHSPCTCPQDQKCVRVSDDISISAFVYRCRTNDESNGLQVLPADVGQEVTGSYV